MSDLNKTTTSETPPAKAKDSPYELTFAKPYTFEGEAYTGVDLSGLEHLSADDFFEATRKLHSEYINPKPESDPQFCCTIAGLASKKPPEFFEGLPVKEVVKVRNAVQHFFLVAD